MMYRRDVGWQSGYAGGQVVPIVASLCTRLMFGLGSLSCSSPVIYNLLVTMPWGSCHPLCDAFNLLTVLNLFSWILITKYCTYYRLYFRNIVLHTSNIHCFSFITNDVSKNNINNLFNLYIPCLLLCIKYVLKTLRRLFVCLFYYWYNIPLYRCLIVICINNNYRIFNVNPI